MGPLFMETLVILPDLFFLRHQSRLERLPSHSAYRGALFGFKGVSLVAWACFRMSLPLEITGRTLNLSLYYRRQFFYSIALST